MVYKENKTTWQKKRWEEINKLLENPDTNLKDSMTLYAEGVELANACKEELAGVEKEIKILDEV